MSPSNRPIRRSESPLGPGSKARIDLSITPVTSSVAVSAAVPAVEVPLVKLAGTVPCEDKRYDPDLWYSEVPADIEQASRICNTACGQLATCLAGALERNEPFGVFGGKSARQRRINSGLDDDPDEAASDEDPAEPSRFDMWVRGMTDLEIAEALQVTHNSIQKWRARNSLPPNGVRGSGPADAIAHVERRALYEQGFSDRQIAEQLGMRTQAITRWRKRAGLSRHHTTFDGRDQVSA